MKFLTVSFFWITAWNASVKGRKRDQWVNTLTCRSLFTLKTREEGNYAWMDLNRTSSRGGKQLLDLQRFSPRSPSPSLFFFSCLVLPCLSSKRPKWCMSCAVPCCSFSTSLSFSLFLSCWSSVQLSVCTEGDKRPKQASFSLSFSLSLRIKKRKDDEEIDKERAESPSVVFSFLFVLILLSFSSVLHFEKRRISQHMYCCPESRLKIEEK